MSGQDETMRLAAEVVDKYSGPLREMQKALRAVADVAKGANLTNTAHVRDQAKAYVGLDRAVRDIAVRTKSMLTPALGAAGVSILSVGAAVAAMVKATKDFGDSTEKIVRLGRETGLAAAKLRELDALATGIGSSPQAMNAGLATFAKNMEQYRRGVGTLAEFVISQHDTGIKAAAEAIRASTDNARAFDMVIDELDHIQSKTGRLADTMQMRENWLEAWGIVKEFANLTGSELTKLKADSDKALGTLPSGWKERGEALGRSMYLLRTAVKGTENAIGDVLAPAFTKLADAEREFLTQSRSGILRDFKILAEDALAIGSAIGKAFTAVDSWRNSKSTQDVFRAIIGPNTSDRLMGDPGASGAPATFKQRGAGIPGFASGGVVTKDMIAAVHEGEVIVPGGGGGLGAGDALKRPIKEGTETGSRAGVFAGLRDWYEFQKGAGEGGGAAGGPGGGMGGAGGPPGGAGMGAPSGHGPGFGAGGAVDVPPVAGGLGSSGEGGINRSRWLAELNANPRLKEELYRHVIGENTDPTANQAAMEEAANRADVRTALRGGGFGSNSNLSYFQGYRNFSAKERRMMDENFRKVFVEGSDVAKGAIDNSSQRLSAKHERLGEFQTTANYGGDRITGHRGVETFEIPGTHESMTGERKMWPIIRRRQIEQIAAAHRQSLPNIGMAVGGGLPAPATFNDRFQGDLLQQGRRSGLIGGAMQHEVTGSAGVTVDFQNMPRGVRIGGSTEGLFKKITLNRGVAMPLASEGA